MKKYLAIFAMVILTSVAFAGNGPGAGQGTCDGSGSTSAGSKAGSGVSSYDLSTETTVTGTVTSFYSIVEDALNPTNPVITLEDGSSLIVQTGPSWFMDNQDFSVEIGDVITVTGSLTVNVNGESTILAKEIVNGDITLVLRDELGFPVWQGVNGGNSGVSRNPGTYMNVAYDISLETTVYGTVNSVNVGAYTPGTYPGYQLTVTLEDGSVVNVMLAPYWYLSNQDFSIEEGVEITLTGVLTTLEDGTEVFVTRLLTYGDIELVLRDELGIPLWGGLRGNNN
jgi:hypothetical protein